jgi:hypothetical protein
MLFGTRMSFEVFVFSKLLPNNFFFHFFLTKNSNIIISLYYINHFLLLFKQKSKIKLFTKRPHVLQLHIIVLNVIYIYLGMFEIEVKSVMLKNICPQTNG